MQKSTCSGIMSALTFWFLQGSSFFSLTYRLSSCWITFEYNLSQNSKWSCMLRYTCFKRYHTEPTFNSGSEPCSESKQRWPGKRYSLSGRNRQVERLECWNEDFGSDFKQLQFQRGWHSLSLLNRAWKHDYRKSSVLLRQGIQLSKLSWLLVAVLDYLYY